MSKHIMVCVSGFSGVGKDEFVKHLVKAFGAVQTGLADPAKRHMSDVYKFTEQQLFGPSEFRNAGDVRIPKNAFREKSLRQFDGPLPGSHDGLVPGIGKDGSCVWLDPKVRHWIYKSNEHHGRPHLPGPPHTVFVPEGDPEFWLSPREALQLYCELMNNLDIDTWIRKGVDDQICIASGKWTYDRMKGILRSQGWTEGMKHVVTCFADFRHIHEIRYVKEFRGPVPFTPVTVRVKRPSVPIPPYNHRSETEQVQIRDAAFDFVVNNDSSIEALHANADRVMQAVLDPSWRPKPWSDEYVLASRRPEEGYAP